MSRRVLVLNHFGLPAGGTGGTRHVDLFSRLAHWEFTVVAANRNYLTRQRYRHRDESFRTVWSTPYSEHPLTRVCNWLSYSVAAASVGLRGVRPDVVYASSPQLLAGVSGWIVARVRRSRFVFEVRDLWPRVLVDMGQLSEDSLVSRILSRVATHLYRSADSIVYMAAGLEQVFLDEGVDDDRICFIPNGADPKDFPDATARNAARERSGMSGIVVVYTGAHGPANGLDLVLDAAEELVDTLREVRFMLVGDGIAKPALVRRAAETGLRNVEFLPSTPRAKTRELIAAADIGLHVLADVELFRYGVSPNKLYDYMAAGIPVITNTGGEIGAMVAEAQSGISASPRGIAEAVRTMVNAGVDQRRRWGAAGRTFMLKHRSPEALAGRLECLLDRVVTAPVTRRGLDGAPRLASHTTGRSLK